MRRTARALACLLLLAAVTIPARPASPQPIGPVQIQNIDQFLDQCPSSDVAWGTITSQFEVRRNRQVIPLPSCTPPISSLPVAQYTDPLIVWQGLRTVFHLSYATSGTLPWTSVSLYNWLAAKVDGFNVQDGAPTDSCCEQIDGKLFVTLVPQDDFNRGFDKRWEGIASNIALYMHEARHMDGFVHVDCCGFVNGCDQTYSTNNLSPFGIQWWLHDAWLYGTMQAGYACLGPSRKSDISGWHLSNCNTSFRTSFCSNLPPALQFPAHPGGWCGDANKSGTLNVADVLYLINYLFAGGPPPQQPCDVNGSGATNVSDVLYLINHLFAGGPAPM